MKPFQVNLQTMLVPLLHMAHQTGWAGALGVLCIAAAIGVSFGASQPLRQEIASIAQERRALHGMARKGAAERSPRERLQAFYARFPARDGLPDTLMRLHREAGKLGINSTRADYRDTPEAGTPLVRVRIELPVTGEYPALRTWLSALLTEMPALAIDGLSLQRDDIGSPQLKARVRFLLVLRNGK